MKSQSWIEVLITLAVFIYLFIYIYNTLINGLVYYSNGINQLLSYQKLYLASYYFSKYPNNLLLYDYTNLSVIAYYTPSVIFLSDNYYECNNCIEVYYNFLNNQIDIIQNSNVNLTSFISFFVFNNNYSLPIYNYSSQVNCNNYYNNTIYGLYYRSLAYCESYLYGNSSINITTSSNILFVTNYISLLDMYNGDKLAALPKILNVRPTTATSLNYFLYLNDSIEYVNLYT